MNEEYDNLNKEKRHMRITVILEKEVSLERIGDLLATAFEGGSNYWYFIDRKIKPPQFEFRYDIDQIYWHVDYPLNKGGELIITTPEEKDDKEYAVNLDTILTGLHVMQDKFTKHFNDFIEENEDAITADVFLQCVCFGDVIYD